MKSLISENFKDRLRLARILKGFSQQELGTEVHVSRQFIHQLESGEKLPRDDVFEAICEALNVTDAFFHPYALSELKNDQCHFRKRKTTPLGLTNRVLAFGTVFEEFVDYLSQYIEFPKSVISDFSASVKHDGNYSRREIEDITDKFRGENGLGLDTPIDNVTDLLENMGVLVTGFEGVSDKVDALSFARRYRVVLRNTAKLSVCRMRFDLAHELGHFILHEGIVTGDSITEAEADYFASAFLFPRKAFSKEFVHCIHTVGNFNWKAILELKKRWKVSQKAIIYRAHSLGHIDSRQYRGANIHFSKTKQSKQEILDDQLPMEEPGLIESSLELLRSEVGISFQEIVKNIGLDPLYMASMLGISLVPEDLPHFGNVSALPPPRFT